MSGFEALIPLAAGAGGMNAASLGLDAAIAGGGAAAAGTAGAGGLAEMAQSMMGMTMGRSIYDWMFGGSKDTPAAPAAVKNMLGTPMGSSSTVSAGPTLRTPDYSSMASAYSVAPGMVNDVITGAGGTPTPPMAGAPYNLGTMSAAPPGIPPGPTGQQQVQTQAPPGIGSWDVYKFMQERALKQAEIKKPFAIAPGIHPGQPVPVTVGKPLVTGSPLQKYAAMLQGLR